MKHLLLTIHCSLFIILVLSGCSGSPFRVEAVEGTVTLDGQPCADAVLTFVPEDASLGKAAYARTDEKGIYKLTAFNGGKSNAGTKTGKYIVSILKEKPVREPKEGEIDVPMISVIPQKYNDAKTSGLTAEVVKGKNVFNFDLKSK
jgi:hypothetical protein